MLEKRKKPSMNAAPKGRMPVASTEGYKVAVSNEYQKLRASLTTGFRYLGGGGIWRGI
jgi:hypothetical protein